MKPNLKKFQFTITGKSNRQFIKLKINNINVRESSSLV